MSGMLFQIENKLNAQHLESTVKRRLAKEEQAKILRDVELSKVEHENTKVIALNVPPEMYAQLQALAEAHGARGMKGALMLAATIGLRHAQEADGL